MKCGRRRLELYGEMANITAIFLKDLEKLAHECGTFWPDYESTCQSKQNELLLRVLSRLLQRL